MTEQMNIKNVPPELLKQAKHIAIEQNKTISEVVRELLKVWVKQNEQAVRNTNR